jgi:proteasome lid subunit RPN8/RPN11
LNATASGLGAGRELTEICRAAHPREAAGFLLGRLADGVITVTDITPWRESSTGTDSFAIPEHELHRAAAYAQDLGEDIVALYHSHPSGQSRLSDGDRAALRHSTWPWVIVTATIDGEVATLTGYAPGEARRIEVRVTH